MSHIKVKINRFHLLLAALVISPITMFSQSTDDMINIFTKAESYYIYEEYELANQLFILFESPDNLNIKYKIGTCYLNISGEKEKSIPFLEEAVKSANYDSKTESLKENRAPLDVYFFLAKAYMINNEFEKAINTLQTFKKLIKETKSNGDLQNIEYVDQIIQACKNAIQFRQVPVVFSKQSLGSDFNLGAINENSAVSYDGNIIVYTERRGIENAIFFSRKERGKWLPPVEITAEINAGKDCSSCSLNSDGTQLFLYKTDNYDGNIYSSNFVDGRWTPVKLLNKNINTKFYESHASVSADGKKLIFASNRPGGKGNLDIYVSELDNKGDWGPAVNIGPDINTPFNEDTPFMTQNDSLLYFSSEGHNSMGGYDIFKSQKNGSDWKTPSNLGYPINSADDDKFFQPLNNGRNAYYSLTTGYKMNGIFYLDMGVGDINLKHKITGKLSLEDTSMVPDKNFSVKVINKISGDTLYKVCPDKSTGSYSINVASGLFKILYTGDGYLNQTIDTMIVQNNSEFVINLDVTLLADTTAILKTAPVYYEKINLTKIPLVGSVDTSKLILNMKVLDVSDKNVVDSDILYYTVQIIALHNPVDVTYFKYITDMKIMYNDSDKFYRYTTGKFSTKEEAYGLRSELIRKGYSEQTFVKKVSK